MKKQKLFRFEHRRKTPSMSRSLWNGAQRSCRNQLWGRAFLAGPERGEKAHVHRQVDICGKVVLRIRYALMSKAMNWIVGGVRPLATLHMR
jgi:hypothetical protein